MKKSINEIIYTKLYERAIEDGVITFEEKAILDTVKVELGQYDRSLKLALSDGLLTQSEIDHLRKSKKIIQAKVWEVADSDIKISRDENQMIEILVSLLTLLYP